MELASNRSDLSFSDDVINYNSTRAKSDDIIEEKGIAAYICTAGCR